MSRRGITLQQARTVLRTNATVIAALLLQKGEADAMLCGVSGAYHDHLRHLTEVLGVDAGHLAPATYSVLVMKKGTYFMCDTQVHANPSAAQIADTAIHTADRVQRFGLTPRLALLSHSNFGTSNEESALRMREALALIRARRPGIEVDGEMQADAALLPALREAALPDSTLSGAANVLVMPGLDAANIAMHLLTALGDGVVVGPILMGLRQPAHVLTPSASVRRVINMSALAVVDAQIAQTAREPGAVSA
jgi:malate dehydrogenase (oxaloacetate-decarboxylating)(NADP+)